ncbi:MAG: cob(I)yrinic acid a,c-diamide adenosyltransferase [Myxococcota bacterium]|nr:cob(I)yrinic acid a,c-diamide adenosyltransferase [Myxococcota bacterium]
MVRLNRIYTRTGDKGSTHLVGGQKVPKDSLRIEAYGTIDELNTILGLVRTFLMQSDAEQALKTRLSDWLKLTQNNLFNLGSDLATRTEDRWEGMPLTRLEDVETLEATIDSLNDDLEPLKSFVIPGGGPCNAFLHQARTVCRRSERIILALSREEAVGEYVLPYVNRLSDALFVWSRWVSKQLGESEFLWEPNVG